MNAGELCDAHNHAHELAEVGRLGRWVANGTSPADWGRVAEHARIGGGRGIASYGLHPWFVGGAPEGWAADLRRRLQADPAAGVGECGLDKTRRSPAMEVQEPVLREQLRLACELDRVLSVHCVRAWGRLLELLREELLPGRGVLLHSYAAPIEMLDGFLAIGEVQFSLCFAGKVSPAADLVRALPAERVLIESDASAENGRDPESVVSCGIRALAEALGASAEQISAQLSSNFDRLFPPQGR